VFDYLAYTLWVTQLVLLGQCISMVTSLTATSPRQLVVICCCQLQQPPNSTFTKTTYMAVRQLRRKPTTVPPSLVLYVSFTDNLQLFISHSLTFTFRCQLLQDTPTVIQCVSCYLHSVFLFAVVFSQVFFLTAHTICYISFCLVFCIVNSVL